MFVRILCTFLLHPSQWMETLSTHVWKKRKQVKKQKKHTHTHKNDTIKLHREPCKVWFGSIVTLHLSCSWFSPASFSLLASGLDSGLVSALHSDGAVAITTKKKKNKKFGGFLKERIRKRPKGWLIKSLRTQNRRILTERKREKESVQMLKKKQWNWRLKVGGREREEKSSRSLGLVLDAWWGGHSTCFYELKLFFKYKIFKSTFLLL